MKTIFEQFDTMDAFKRALDRPINEAFKLAELHSQITKKSMVEWFGTKSYEEAINLYTNGWTEKANEIRREFVKFERVTQRAVSYEKTRPTTSVVGFAPHVPNAILGLPNSMIHTERQPMKAKAVRIIYNMTQNAGANADTILQAGLTVLKIAYSMERQGYRVRLDLVPKCSEWGRERCLLMVSVKDWRQPIDIKKVAFPIASPSMFRRLAFHWLETTPDCKNSGWTGGYGRSFEDTEKEKKMLAELGVLGDNDYYINVGIAKGYHFDPAKVAKAIGIKNY